MTAYYNEFDPYAAAWLRALVRDGRIAPGDVDERSIVDVQPEDLKGYDQCHFFAGIGGWSYAARLAGIPDDFPIWTGSCPCQPFSTAGKQKGKDDERHLWPIWFQLIRECRPSRIFGEQVAGAIAHGWWDDVASDLEVEGYACAAAVLPACSVGAPHKRDRLWFVANAQGAILRPESPAGHERGNGIMDCALADAPGKRRRSARSTSQAFLESGTQQRSSGLCGHVENPKGIGWGEGRPESAREQGRSGVAIASHVGHAEGPRQQSPESPIRSAATDGNGIARPGFAGADFGDFEWLDCPDGKRRPVKPGIRLLAHGIPGRVGAIKGYGNAIVPQVAAEFMKAAL